MMEVVRGVEFACGGDAKGYACANEDFAGA
jgi:hypothetical protein